MAPGEESPPPLPPPWIIIDGDDGAFYYNEETGESQWEHPGDEEAEVDNEPAYDEEWEEMRHPQPQILIKTARQEDGGRLAVVVENHPAFDAVSEGTLLLLDFAPQVLFQVVTFERPTGTRDLRVDVELTISCLEDTWCGPIENGGVLTFLLAGSDLEEALVSSLHSLLRDDDAGQVPTCMCWECNELLARADDLFPEVMCGMTMEDVEVALEDLTLLTVSYNESGEQQVECKTDCSPLEHTAVRALNEVATQNYLFAPISCERPWKLVAEELTRMLGPRGEDDQDRRFMEASPRFLFTYSEVRAHHVVRLRDAVDTRRRKPKATEEFGFSGKPTSVTPAVGKAGVPEPRATGERRGDRGDRGWAVDKEGDAKSRVARDTRKDSNFRDVRSRDRWRSRERRDPPRDPSPVRVHNQPPKRSVMRLRANDHTRRDRNDDDKRRDEARRNDRDKTRSGAAHGEDRRGTRGYEERLGTRRSRSRRRDRDENGRGGRAGRAGDRRSRSRVRSRRADPLGSIEERLAALLQKTTAEEPRSQKAWPGGFPLPKEPPLPKRPKEPPLPKRPKEPPLPGATTVPMPKRASFRPTETVKVASLRPRPGIESVRRPTAKPKSTPLKPKPPPGPPPAWARRPM